MVVHNERLGARLKEYRKSQGWTQEKAAERFGLSLVYYGEIERGRRTPAIRTLLSFCEEMNCSISDLTEVNEYFKSNNDFDADTSNMIYEINEIIKSSTPELIQSYLTVISAIYKGYQSKK